MYSVRPTKTRCKPSPFPKCDLHQLRIVDAFPPRCALSVASPTDNVSAYQDRGWDRLGAPEPDYTGGLNDLFRSEVCRRCCARLSNNPHVRRLRRLERLEAVA